MSIVEKNKYGSRIKDERLRLRLTQQAVAEATGISKATQVAYEAGAHVPGLDYVERAATIGIDPIYVQWGMHQKEFLISELDWDILKEVLDEIQEWMVERNIQIPASKQTDIIRTIFEQHAISEQIEPAKLNRLLKLVS